MEKGIATCMSKTCKGPERYPLPIKKSQPVIIRKEEEREEERGKDGCLAAPWSLP